MSDHHQKIVIIVNTGIVAVTCLMSLDRPAALEVYAGEDGNSTSSSFGRAP